jgi:ATP-binding cassette subfamily B protein
MGFFAGIDAEKYDRQYSDRELLKRILEYFQPHRKRLALIAGTVLLMSGASSLQSIVVSKGIDLLEKGQILEPLLFISLLVLLIGLFRWVANWLSRRLTIRTIADVVIKLASDGFKAASEHDLSFYDEFSSGKILSRITSDTRDFGNLIALTTDLIAELIESTIILVILFSIDWRLTLLVLGIIPFVFGFAISYRTLARKVTRNGMRAMAEVNSTIKETVSGISVAKNFRQEASIYEVFDQANKLSFRVNIRRGLTLAAVFPILNALGGIASAIMVYVGGLSVSQGLITSGVWYLFLTSLDRFLYPVMNMSSFFTQVQNGLSAAERVFALIDADPAVVQTDHQPVSKLEGKIEFQHLDFHYKVYEPILNDFNLSIRPGENLAIVGHTGAGKSSIAKLIARFYEFQDGKILIDGKDIRTFDLSEYRKQLGIVSQVPFLFSGTVAENIRFSRPEAGDTEIAALARKIGNGEWLETLSNGLNTEVGERGGQLSMGQRQMVSLMRVLIQRPAIFILDEATASIDPFTEWQIQQALNLILESTTSILIAHRLSTVKSADRIIVMKTGQIIEEGSHDALLEQHGHYAELYNSFFRHQSIQYVQEAKNLKDSVQATQ